MADDETDYNPYDYRTWETRYDPSTKLTVKKRESKTVGWIKFPIEVFKSWTQLFPHTYFTTSGEAIQKLETLIKHLDEIKVEAKKVLATCVQLKAKHKFLEMTTELDGVWISPKDPRISKKDKNDAN